jgi:uncharacterized protein YecE (DUF72 family)
MVRVGTSGWHYPAGKGTWNGVFYPARRPRGFDELAYYAEHFDIVEVNATFYRMPDPGHVAKWMARTPADFQFAIKLFQKFTHPDMYLARAGAADWNLSRDDVTAFREGLGPLAGSHRLAALLVQFPPSFHADAAMREYLSWILDAFAGYPLAVELRHRSWFAPESDTAARLAAGGASLVIADDPEMSLDGKTTSEVVSGGAASETTSEVVFPTRLISGASPVYLRFHGRNRAAWWNHEHAEDRYNYLYSPTELQPFAQAAQQAASAGRKVLAFMNNHYSAKAAANAAILKSQLGQTVPGDYEREMVDRYPELRGVVTTSGLPL